MLDGVIFKGKILKLISGMVGSSHNKTLIRLGVYPAEFRMRDDLFEIFTFHKGLDRVDAEMIP